VRPQAVERTAASPNRDERTGFEGQFTDLAPEMLNTGRTSRTLGAVRTGGSNERIM
jgi:hypothetical protein